MEHYQLILGSQSPRRRELLEGLGLHFTVCTADIDEARYETRDPVGTVCATCAAKAAAVAARLSADPALTPGQTPRLILTSDTIVVLDDRIMGKPPTEAEAAQMLSALSGRVHSVYTAFTLLPQAAFEALPVPSPEALAPFTRYEQTLVRFRPLTRQEIADYIATGEPMDKAGAYGIQGLGAMLVEGIEGDYFTVMGLPLCRVAQALKEYGIDPLKGCKK